jgi:hypothetical protein
LASRRARAAALAGQIPKCFLIRPTIPSRSLYYPIPSAGIPRYLPSSAAIAPDLAARARIALETPLSLAYAFSDYNNYGESEIS